MVIAQGQDIASTDIVIKNAEYIDEELFEEYGCISNTYPIDNHNINESSDNKNTVGINILYILFAKFCILGADLFVF